MSVVGRIKDNLIDNIYTLEELDRELEAEKYYPVEIDEDEETGILKYTNGRSQIWVKYIYDNQDYLVSDVTLRTKKCGKTTVHAIRNGKDIKGFMDYYRDNEMYDDFLAFMFEIFLARRIGDTLSLKWSDFYEENGNRKSTLNTLIEQKTEKMVDITITKITWDYIDWYCEKTNIDPLNPPHDEIFWSKEKESLPSRRAASEKEWNKMYKDATAKMAARFRARFKKAAKTLGVEEVSTHSLRKTFGYISYLLNKHDPDCLHILQTILGHDSIETTKRYIDVMAEKAEKTFYDVGKYISDIDNGIDPVIDNLPVIAFKTNDFRDILLKAFNAGKENVDCDAAKQMEIMNQLITEMEKLRVS